MTTATLCECGRGKILEGNGTPECCLACYNEIPSWMSVRDGKWHIAVSPEPTWAKLLPSGRYDFDHKETTRCGITVTPVNVTLHEHPYHDAPHGRRHICRKCVP